MMQRRSPTGRARPSSRDTAEQGRDVPRARPGRVCAELPNASAPPRGMGGKPAIRRSSPFPPALRSEGGGLADFLSRGNRPRMRNRPETGALPCWRPPKGVGQTGRQERLLSAAAEPRNHGQPRSCGKGGDRAPPSIGDRTRRARGPRLQGLSLCTPYKVFPHGSGPERCPAGSSSYQAVGCATGGAPPRQPGNLLASSPAEWQNRLPGGVHPNAQLAIGWGGLEWSWFEATDAPGGPDGWNGGQTGWRNA